MVDFRGVACKDSMPDMDTRSLNAAAHWEPGLSAIRWSDLFGSVTPLLWRSKHIRGTMDDS